MKFNEKWVEQTFKDVIIPLQNVFNFFETYAKIDNRKSDNTTLILSETNNLSQEFITRILPDITIDNIDFHIQNPIDDYPKYADIISQNKWKKILITNADTSWEIIELPTYKITSDLDRRILAELHQMMITLDQKLASYILDEATKSVIDFLDKLTNWRLRRSRRRFWANWMTDDKNSAFSTLFWVLQRYLQVLAPLAPFITEFLWLKLQDFIIDNDSQQSTSIHLSFRPFASQKYIDLALIDEIAQVRKIIKLALFVRWKNKIAIKQPLSRLEVKLN